MPKQPLYPHVPKSRMAEAPSNRKVGVSPFQQYCSRCGMPSTTKDIIYPDMTRWAREYTEAKAKGEPLPEVPGPAVTKCCGALPIDPPSPELEVPPLAPDTQRIEGIDFSEMIRLSNTIGKSPRSIKAYLRLDKIPSLFGPHVYFFDVRARYLRERLKEVL